MYVYCESGYNSAVCLSTVNLVRSQTNQQSGLPVANCTSLYLAHMMLSCGHPVPLTALSS